MIDGKQSMTFTLAPYYVQKIHANHRDGTFKYEVQLNMWNYRTDEEWDYIYLHVDVNNAEVLAPANPSPHLLYLTPYCYIKPFATNTITITCPRPEMLDDYAFSVCIVERLHPVEIILRNPVDRVWDTLALVDRRIVGYGQYEMDLECKRTGSKMKYPCRSIFCTHPEAFDLELFLYTAQFDQQWMCPICGRQMKYEDIVLDVFLFRKVARWKTRLLFFRPRLAANLTDNNDDDIFCELELITIHDD